MSTPYKTPYGLGDVIIKTKRKGGASCFEIMKERGDWMSKTRHKLPAEILQKIDQEREIGGRNYDSCFDALSYFSDRDPYNI